jgi:hypothetical protein
MPRWAVRLRNRIPAAFMPRIAAQYSSRRECATAHCTMSPQGVNRVVATTRPKSAMGADHWPDGPLIGANGGDRHLSGRCHDTATARLTRVLPIALRKSSRSARKSLFPVPVLPISTRSSPAKGTSASSSRAASRSLRLARFRTTALPIFFVTVKPMRTGPSSARGRACRTNPWVAALRPFAATRKNSARRLRRVGELCDLDTRWPDVERPPMLRRRAAYGPWHADWPRPGGRRPWPCGSETRAGACGQASTVDRCASRRFSRRALARQLVQVVSGGLYGWAQNPSTHGYARRDNRRNGNSAAGPCFFLGANSEADEGQMPGAIGAKPRLLVGSDDEARRLLGPRQEVHAGRRGILGRGLLLSDQIAMGQLVDKHRIAEFRQVDPARNRLLAR